MTIQVGDNVPQGAFAVMGAEGPSQITSEDLFTGKKWCFLRCQGLLRPPVLLHIFRALWCTTTNWLSVALIRLPVSQSMMCL